IQWSLSICRFQNSTVDIDKGDWYNKHSNKQVIFTTRFSASQLFIGKDVKHIRHEKEQQTWLTDYR
ncbi:hypothetical protein, partial [Staphylococcus haemolyticus]|uniref:hypothetical protein n=1 Tax=Staphylococcus haemolyticus TaxID=1283 RepID=UPI001C5CD8C1